MLKKWFSILVILGFASTYTFAYDDDDDYDDYDEEEEAPKKPAKKAPPKKAKKAEDSAPSRMAFAVSLSGSQNDLRFVYDLGNGIEIDVGLGLNRYQKTPNEGEAPDAEQSVVFVLGGSYELGKGLLNYGLGVDLGGIMEPTITTSGNDKALRPAGGTSFYGFPFFYASAELVKNLSLKLSAGINVHKTAEQCTSVQGNENTCNGAYTEMNIQLQTAGKIIFYFM